MLKQKLCAALHMGQDARIESMSGNWGGQNQGMWVLQDSQRSFIIKATSAMRRNAAFPSEAEAFAKIAQRHPMIRTDPQLAFPVKVLLCRDASGARQHDLIVMHKAPGIQLSTLIARKCKRQADVLNDIFQGAGQFIAGIHNRYQMQHGDFQPSNVFYDEATDVFTLIDVCGMESAHTHLDSDVDHFLESLRLVARGLQATELSNDGNRYFQMGYSAVRQ
jgi:hypothetical protein